MDAFGYKRTTNNEILFARIVKDFDQKILLLRGKLGEVDDLFTIIGDESMDFDGVAVPLLEKEGFVFDFNDKSQELLIRFALSKITNLYEFRFEKLEPVIHYALQNSGNGFCDYAYCDDEYLNLVPWVYNSEVAVETILEYVKRALESVDALDSVWLSREGVPERKIWGRLE